MAIYQGGNAPIKLYVKHDAAELKDLAVSLWNPKNGDMLKSWGMDDVEVNEYVISCPLTKAETTTFPAGKIRLEAKGVGSDGIIVFWETQMLNVVERLDKELLLEDVEPEDNTDDNTGDDTGDDNNTGDGGNASGDDPSDGGDNDTDTPTDNTGGDDTPGDNTGGDEGGEDNTPEEG